MREASAGDRSLTIIPDLQNPLIHIRSLVKAHLSSARNGIHDVMGCPRTIRADASYGFPRLVRKCFHSPALNCTLNAFPFCNGDNINDLPFLEDIAGTDLFA